MPLVLSLDWTPAEPLPAEYRGQIPAVLALAEQAVQPATTEAFAVAIDNLVQWVEVFGVVVLPTDQQKRRVQLAQIVARYRKDLSDIPADLLQEAIATVTSTAEYRVLPLPGDIRKTVAAELERRRHAVRRLTTAKRMARYEQPEPPREVSEEARAKVRAITQQALQGLTEKSENLGWTNTDPHEREASPLRQQYREAREAVAAAPRTLIPRPWVEGEAADRDAG